MLWTDKFKLNKGLARAITEAGYVNPTDIQLKTLSRIMGGQDVITIAPEGSGKTTAYIIGVLNRVGRGFNDAPRVLILAPGKAEVVSIIEQFNTLNKNSSVKIVGLYAAPGTEAQMEQLADGADIVVATPDRARAIYLKLGLNLNKIDLLIIDDAEAMVKQGLQLPVAELANSITKAQHLVFTQVLHGKLNKMIDPFMKVPAIIEAEQPGNEPIETYDQVLYQVPNFKTKLNLLDLFMQDEELFTKTVVFVNTRVTAGTVYKHLKQSLHTAVAVINPLLFDPAALQNMEEFKQDDKLRVLIIANDDAEDTDLDGVPFIIHFDMPDDKDQYISRIVKSGMDEETLAICFATDLELLIVKKIEQAVGKKMQPAQLPAELFIEQRREKTSIQEKGHDAPVKNLPETGGAFHQKKISNAKTYNYSSGTKARMNNKRKH